MVGEVVPFTTAGYWITSITALFVLDFLLLQLYGLAHTGKLAPSHWPRS